MKNNQEYTGLEIAIIGVACRFPGANNWRDFWKNLVNGTESMQLLSDQELLASGVDDRTLQRTDYVKVKSPLKGKDLFDAAFFDYRHNEASLMNPVHRLFHECVWEALEDAGYDPEQTKGLIGLYAGAGGDINWKVNSLLHPSSGEVDGITLDCINNKDYLTSLLSYKLNLRGPSLSINTACSTSLVAVNLACKSLLLGETSMALAGGASVLTEQQRGYFYQEGMINSVDGHCKAFDKDASGTVTGEGVGVVVLKRLADAIRDRDQVFAIIKGSATNNDAGRKVGFTAPSIEGQADCIRKAQKFAKVEPESIGYVEAHGTGTRLGDPIEVQALNMAFKGNKNHRCALGSVKTNIGHLDTAAGMAGLIKTALCLKHKQIPASLHYQTPNPDIDFAGGPFYVNDTLTEWQRSGDAPLRAGVSSFGIGGTNAHAVLQEAPPGDPGDAGREYKLLTVSAKTENAVARYLESLRNHLLEETDISLADVSYTLQVGRRHFSYRKSIVYKDKAELLKRLAEGLGNDRIGRSAEWGRSVVFMFPGQASQYQQMGRDLYRKEPFFRQEMDKGFAFLEALTGERFGDILFPQAEDTGRIHRTRYAQPLIFLTEYALARWMMAIGVTPQCMIGHSIGEYVAACIGGVFSFEDALRLVVKRAELMGSLPSGTMVSVALGAEDAGRYVNENISLAAVNAPGQVVLSGDAESMAGLVRTLKQAGVPCVKLNTSHAFHSAMQDSILDAFREALEKVTFNPIRIPFISNVTGMLAAEETASPDYWVRHLRHTVRFSEGIHTLLHGDREPVFIEVGAGSALTSLLKQHCDGKITPFSVSLIRSAKETGDDLEYLTNSVGQLWAWGVRIDWAGYYREEKRTRISLPTYSFEPTRYVAEVNPLDSAVLARLDLGAQGGNKELKDWLYYPSWKRSVAGAAQPAKTQKVYLFFSFNDSFFRAVNKELLGHQHATVEVVPGKKYVKTSKWQYEIDPAQWSHFRLLMRDLQKDAVVITDVIYAWGTAAGPAKIRMVQDDQVLNLAFFSLVNVVQALQQAGKLKEQPFVILTNTLHKVIGTEKPRYAQALLLGLLNVLPQEYGVRCRNIDLDLGENRADSAGRLVASIRNDDNPQERVVALRHGQRWIQDFQKNSQLVHRGESAIKRGGVYLVTGGLGNVGYVLSKHLVERYEAKVVLTGRKTIEEKKNAGVSNQEWLHRLNQLKSGKGEVRYYSTDVADGEALERTVAEVESTLGPIQGVIHTAGIIDNDYFELIEDITAAKAMAMFAPKVQGIENLYEVFRKRTPDFVWVTSSVATVLGGLSFSAYAAANLFMDYFISAKAEELPNWKSVGLAELAFTEEEMQRESNALKPAEMIELFEWSLSANNSPVILETKSDLAKRMQQVHAHRQEPTLSDLPEDHAVRTRQERPNLPTSYLEAETETEEKLKIVFEAFFGMEKIGVEDAFFELGGDSLRGMVLLKRIKNEFSVNISLRDFLECSNIRGVAIKIDEMLWFKSEVQMEFEITI